MAIAKAPLTFDPICGMWLDSNQAAATYAFLGHIYVFCCAECRDLFAESPEAHVARLAHEPEQSAGHRCPHQRQRVISAVRVSVV
jgi:YHS domain-containing protein